jgi:uncharacterized damage-inducible protein DinB
MLADLAAGRRDLLEALRGITEDTAARSPGPGRWSVLECVEHVAVAEDLLFGNITASRAVEGAAIDERRERLIPLRGRDRSVPVEAPEAARPTGRYATLAAAVERFAAGRERTVRFVEECHDDLRARLTTHPLIGQVNCWETLLMMAMHPLRHAAQIREIRAALGQ